MHGGNVPKSCNAAVMYYSPAAEHVVRLVQSHRSVLDPLIDLRCESRDLALSKVLGLSKSLSSASFTHSITLIRQPSNALDHGP